MRKQINIIFFFVSIITNISFSQNPTYNLYANNFHRWSPDSLTFDISLLHTNPGSTNFTYAAGQYFFRFNPAIANGGTLTYKIVTSELPQQFRPINPTVSGNELRLASNQISMINAPTIATSLPGTLIVRMSLKTSASSFATNQALDMRWRNSDDPPLFTKISAFVGTLATNITQPGNHFLDSTTVSINQISAEVPAEYKVFQNYPNPFNPMTKIKFNIPKLSNVKLIVYDISGREIKKLLNNKLSPGSYEFEFGGYDLSSGMYFYRLQAEDYVETKKMVLLK